MLTDTLKQGPVSRAPGAPVACWWGPPAPLELCPQASLGTQGGAGKSGRGSRTVRTGDGQGSLCLLPRSGQDCLPSSLCFSRKRRLAEEKRPCENISMNLFCSSGGTRPLSKASGIRRGRDEAGQTLAAQTPPGIRPAGPVIEGQGPRALRGALRAHGAPR